MHHHFGLGAVVRRLKEEVHHRYQKTAVSGPHRRVP